MLLVRMLLVILVLFAVLYLAALGLSKLKEILTRSRGPALPPARSLGRLEPGRPLDVDQRTIALRRSVFIIQRLDVDHGALPEREEQAQSWLQSYRDGNFDSSDLLAQAGTLLMAAENEHQLLGLLDDDIGREISEWLDDYLDRNRP